MEEFDEGDASMAVVLHDKVRELVRKHLKEALEDYNFMGNVMSHPLSEAVSRSAYGGVGFANAVRDVIRQQLMKP